jgi:hypothetical protein
VAVDLRSLVARLHESFNERDLDAWSAAFDDDVDRYVHHVLAVRALGRVVAS